MPEGAFYCYPSVKGVLGKELAGSRPASSAQLAEVILDHADVAVVPGEAFGTPGYFRLSCALPSHPAWFPRLWHDRQVSLIAAGFICRNFRMFPLSSRR